MKHPIPSAEAREMGITSITIPDNSADNCTTAMRRKTRLWQRTTTLRLPTRWTPLKSAGRFRIEPRSSTPIAFDTMSLVGVPSPIAFDSVDILTTSVRNFVLFNVFPSLVDSIIVYDVIHSHPSFLTEEMSFTIPAQERRVVELAFSPDDPGWHHDTISIFTNVGQLCLYANGIGKGAPANVGRDVKGTSFRLKPIYPNPLNASASISYVLPRTGHVRIKILDVLGREVVILLDHQEVAGDHSIHWQGLDRRHRRVASGVYFVVAEWEGWRHVGKLLFVK